MRQRENRVAVRAELRIGICLEARRKLPLQIVELGAHVVDRVAQCERLGKRGNLHDFYLPMLMSTVKSSWMVVMTRAFAE